MALSARFGYITIPVMIIAATTCCLALQMWDGRRIHEEQWGGAVLVGSQLNEATKTAVVNVSFPDKPSIVSIDDIIKSSIAKKRPDSIVDRAIKFNSNQFLFLGYLSENEDDLNHLAQYYVEKVASGQSMDDVIPLSTTRKDGRNALLRAPLPKDRPAGSAWSNWYQDASRVPVFVELSCLEGTGGYVIFLDGSFKYFPFARGSVWPLTRHGIGSIRTIANPVVDTK